MNFDDVSQESRQFLNELRLYLFVNGRNEKEADEIVEELHVHLREAEENGKSVEHVIGGSPREYMESLSGEMKLDIYTWSKFIFIILISFLAMVVLQDAMKGTMVYSLVELVGYVIVLAVITATVLSLYKYVAGKSLSKKKEWMLFGFAGFLPLLLFLAIIIVNRLVESPVYVAGETTSWVLGCAALVCLIAISVWSKNFLLIGVIALYIVPDYLLTFTNLDEATQALMSTVVLLGGLVLMVFYLIQRGRY